MNICLTPYFGCDKKEAFLKVIHCGPARFGKAKVHQFIQRIPISADGINYNFSLKKLAKLVHLWSSDKEDHVFEEAREGVVGR